MLRNMLLIGRLVRGLGPRATRQEVRDLLLELERHGDSSRPPSAAYRYYRSLMGSVGSYAPYAHGAPPPVDYDLVIDLMLVQQERGDGVLGLVDKYPAWRSAIDVLRNATFAEGMTSPSPKLLLYRQDELLLAASFGAHPMAHVAGDIQPGEHAVVLDSGQVLWGQALHETEVSWRLAFPGRPIRLAAKDTPVRGGHPFRTWRVLDGLAEIRLFPGIEAASLELWMDGLRGVDSDDLS